MSSNKYLTPSLYSKYLKSNGKVDYPKLWKHIGSIEGINKDANRAIYYKNFKDWYKRKCDVPF